ncbi:MAG: inositol phosphatase, partial [Chloroflexi bacterium]|nr:inositol phosphatase [Chloroflexota bacterium]
LWVAQGEAEVGLADADGLWDLAPLLVIVEEAGGRMTDLGGARTVACALAVASNGLLHDQVLGVLRGEA